MRRLLLCAVLLVGCTRPGESGVKAIVGAKLERGAGMPVLEYSVVVIAGGKFRAVGPQSSIPVPKDAEIVRGTGKIIEPDSGGDPIEAGKPANLVMRDAATGSVESTMHNGDWIQ
jgi:cytosine/adenosine deaminase-related metal-dependent hydrolase